MPVFDFSNAPGGKKTESVCTYTTFQSNEKEKTADEPILVLDNQSRQWKHHSGGVFANQSQQKVPENWSDFMEVCDYFAAKGITPVIANNYASLRKLIAAKSLYSVYQQDTAAAIKEFNREPAKLANTLRPGIEMVEEMIDRKWIDCVKSIAPIGFYLARNF